MLLMMVPPATAASVDGEIQSPQIHIEGELLVSSASAAIDLAPAARAGEAWTISFSSLDGRYVTAERDHASASGGLAGLTPQPGEPTQEAIALGAGRIGNVSCAERCTLLLVPEGDASVSWQGRLDGLLSEHRVPEAYFAGMHGQAGAFRWIPPAGSITLGAADDRQTGAPRFTGDATLVVWNATASAADAEQTFQIETWTRTERTAAVGPASLTHITVRYAVLHLRDAILNLGAQSDAMYVGPPQRYDLDGTILSPAAHGELVVDGALHRLDGRSLRIDGAVGGSMGLRPAAAPIADNPESRAQLRGTADVVSIGAQVIERTPTVAAERVAWSAALMGGLATLAWLARGAAFGALYTRLTRGTLLDNPNRARIYATVQANPGITPAALTRLVGMNEIVVRHHMRMLVHHRVVLTQRTGKLRSYVAAQDQRIPGDLPALATLQHERRRRLAESVVRSTAPPSQAELASALSMSARLVSHHVRKLESAGLLRKLGAMPYHYQATPTLARLLDHERRPEGADRESVAPAR